MEIKQAIIRSRLRAQAEAVALNLPQELADDIYSGIIADDTLNWDKQTYINWCEYIDVKYNLSWDDWKYLYISISQIMGEFGEKIDK